MSLPVTRAGHYVKQAAGFRAFVPAPLPPTPPVHFDADMVAFLSRADQALGRLDGLAQTLPNPDLFVAMYVRREGEQCTLSVVQPCGTDGHNRRTLGGNVAA
jgi:hypothetical protein